jgi:membrane protein YqaA with SNARE-associated domain
LVFLTLFAISFLAATLLPLGSEALLLYDISLGYDVFSLILVATIGNTLGSIVNYFLGLKGMDFLISKKYTNPKRLEDATKIFKKYGAFSLLLSWVPIIGDPITFIAGVLKYDIKKFVLIVFFAKGMRYVVVGMFILTVTSG